MKEWEEIVESLKKEFPGKNIICLPEDNPTEIICEVEPIRDHLEYSIAIAYILHSDKHYHKNSTEKYTVEKRMLCLFLDDGIEILKRGEECVIAPEVRHWAIGDFTRVRVESRPGWMAGDHFLVAQRNPRA